MTHQELLYKNLMVIKDHFSSKFRFKELDKSILITGFRPVVIKATLEKLMNEELITTGRVTTFENCVVYCPTGKRKFYDENYSI